MEQKSYTVEQLFEGAELVDNKSQKSPSQQIQSTLSKPETVFGLYFSAHWCPPCRKFTPLLGQVYQEVNKAEKKFEVVFVSSDKDEEAFQHYHATMPWLALPFDQREKKNKLSQTFDVEGIPTLVLFDGSTGQVISTEAVSRVYEYGAEGFPWTDSKIEQLEKEAEKKMSVYSVPQLLSAADGSRDFVIDNKGEKTPISKIAPEVLALYFSAHWCPPCRGFTPVLAKIYTEVKQSQGSNFEVVFLSSDSSEQEFNNYLGEMPWLAVPFSDRETKQRLSQLYKIQGIPSLVLVEGKTGKLLMLEGRANVIRCGAKGYPFTNEKLNELQKAEMKTLPKKVKSEKYPHEHELELCETVYRGDYDCDGCGQPGSGWAYHCAECSWDLHPNCAVNQ